MTDREHRESFVFGSNEAGRHGKGAALHARKHYGAVYGVGFGCTGDAWAIPTKDGNLRTLPLDQIGRYVRQFLAYATENPELTFKVTAIGTGLAGHRHEDVAPMFDGAPANCQTNGGNYCNRTSESGRLQRAALNQVSLKGRPSRKPVGRACYCHYPGRSSPSASLRRCNWRRHRS